MCIPGVLDFIGVLLQFVCVFLLMYWKDNLYDCMFSVYGCENNWKILWSNLSRNTLFRM